jgi:high-affinity iron transporter
MILIGAGLHFLFVTATLGQVQQPPSDPTPTVRRIAATAQLAAQEYRIGVDQGRIVTHAEVDEARMFLEEARRAAAGLSAVPGVRPVAALDSLLALVAAVAAPDTLDARVRALATALADGYGVVLDQLPRQTPSLARGAEIYRESCAGCHGDAGRGDGRLAATIQPPPTDLTGWATLKDRSPLDYYRRVTIGVVGTAMPAFEARVPAEDRWAVALYASTLRLPSAGTATAPAADSLSSFAVSGRMSDVDLLAALGAPGDSSAAGLARVAAIRSAPPGGGDVVAGRVIDQVRAQVESAYALARTGDPGAAPKAFDAYMTFEQVEREVRAKNPGLAAELESEFAALRTQAAGGATPTQLAGVRERLAAGLERAERTLSDSLSPTNLFVQSFIIMLREGLEAILIVGALMTFLVKMGAAERRRDIHLGVGAAIGASLLTALALETVFHLSAAHREALEGGTMVVATAVLFYVSYWLLSKMEVVKWNQFVKSKVHDAVTSGSALALASASFLAVYREGFETVLFYKALFVSGGSGGAMPVLGGMAAGGVILVGVYVAIHRFGVRLPLKPFFGVTSAFLYYMAFVFAGKGIAELQEGSLITTTILPWAPRIPALGIYPTAESLAAQGVLIALALVALVWTFVLAPRRSALATAAASAAPRMPAKAPPGTGARGAAPLTPSARQELSRSLERMEADLAELRAEVERMRQHLHDARHSRSV